MVRGKLPPIRWAWIAAGVVTAVAVIALFTFRSRPVAGHAGGLLGIPQRRQRESRQVGGVEADTIRFERRDGTLFETTAPPGYVAFNPTFLSGLLERGVHFSATPGRSRLEELYQTLGIGLFVFAIAGLVLFRATGRVTTLEKVRAVDPDNVPVTFNDVAGVDEAKDEVREIVDFLKDPTRFAVVGGRIPRGILLVGLPARAKPCWRDRWPVKRACHSSRPAARISSRCMPASARRVRRLFKEARRHSRASSSSTNSTRLDEIAAARP